MKIKEENKKIIKEFLYLKYKSEAVAWSKLSLQRPLTDLEFKRYKEVCSKIGINV